MEESEKRITPERIVFKKSFIAARVSLWEEYRIFYEDMVWAYVSVPNGETEDVQRPDIADITEDVKGDFVVYDKKRCRWVFETDRIGQTAGNLLKRLCFYAPYIVAGGQNWFDITDKAEFDMIRQMVKVRRACGR